MAGVRQCLSIGLILMVISEMFASSSGLGLHHRAVPAFLRDPGDVDRHRGPGPDRCRPVLIFQWVERRVLRWYHGLREVENAV